MRRLFEKVVRGRLQELLSELIKVDRLTILGTNKRRHFREKAFILESVLSVIILLKLAVYMLVVSLLIVSI